MSRQEKLSTDQDKLSENADLYRKESGEQAPGKSLPGHPAQLFGREATTSPSDIPLTTDNILFLQRTAGNRAVNRLIQAKLKINQPGDRYEREADRVAEQVMCMPDAEGTGEPVKGRMGDSANRQIGRIQRRATTDEEERKRPEEEGAIQMKPAGTSGLLQRQVIDAEEERKQQEEETQTIHLKENPGQETEASDGVASQINNLRGGGEPLPDDTRAFYESRFGQDFSGVRVHKDGQAAESAKAINARAYTAGQDIVFGTGEYSPESGEGKRLLAHELTHTVQQGRRSEHRLAGSGPIPNLLQQNSDPGTMVVQRQSFWFQDPKKATAKGSSRTAPQSRRQQVHVEMNLTTIGNIYVRFAYSAAKIGVTGPHQDIKDAKLAIARAIQALVADLGSWGGTQQQVRQQKTARARLKEALKGFGSSSPLNIFISAFPTPVEISSAKVSPFAGQIWVDKKDINDPKKLQSAIYMPLLMLSGGSLPTSGGLKNIPKASPSDLKRAMLHESLHVMLINQSKDANAIWDNKKAHLARTGPKATKDKFVELVRKFLIAQEEVFAYDSEATLYPPVNKNRAAYQSFIANSERYFNKQKLKLTTIKKIIPVSEKVDGRRVSWSIRYKMPEGTINLTAKDRKVIDLLLAVYP